MSARTLIHTTGIAFSKDINRKIIEIPSSLSNLKAMLRWIISNKPTEHGFKIQTIWDKLTSGNLYSPSQNKTRYSEFKRVIKSNEAILTEFNLAYDKDSDKVFYIEQLEDISFVLPVNTKKLNEILVSKQEKTSIKEGEIIVVDVSKMIGSHFLIDKIEYELIEIYSYIKDSIL